MCVATRVASFSLLADGAWFCPFLRACSALIAISEAVRWPVHRQQTLQGRETHHAVASGSEMISEISWAKIEATLSAAEAPLGPIRWNSQKPGHLLTLPTKPKLKHKNARQSI